MVILQFSGGIPNTSAVAENDLVYYVANIANQWSGANYLSNQSELSLGVSSHIFIGHISSISRNMTENGVPTFTITVEEPSNTVITPPSSDDFIFFVKNNLSELAALRGYYGQLTMENNSDRKAELFAISCEITESSK
tara:strand:+ start:54 stop:467 length:414 start_codon:yes stop_codon:yes gene_type:complete